MVKACSHCRRGSCHLCTGRANVVTAAPVGQPAQWSSVPCACSGQQHRPGREAKRKRVRARRV